MELFKILVGLVALLGACRADETPLLPLPLTISNDPNDVKFYHYTSNSVRHEIVFNVNSTLTTLIVGAPTTIVIDGFLSNSTTPMAATIRAAQLTKTGENVIVVDYGKLSGAGNNYASPISAVTTVTLAASYVLVIGNTQTVGQRVGEFIQFMERANIAAQDVTIIGHSLGAHISGIAGNYTNGRGKKLRRISGLDPAGINFSVQLDPSQRITKNDASFVDLYHTNRGMLGDLDLGYGTIDVFVNGGTSQPGCDINKDLLGGMPGYCSHSYSWKLYAATYSSGDFQGCSCSTGLLGVASTCTCDGSSLSQLLCNSGCSNALPMGYGVDMSLTGNYRLLTPDTFSAIPVQPYY